MAQPRLLVFAEDQEVQQLKKENQELQDRLALLDSAGGKWEDVAAMGSMWKFLRSCSVQTRGKNIEDVPCKAFIWLALGHLTSTRPWLPW